MSDDPRSAEPVPAPPYEEEPSTTGVVAEGDEGRSTVPTDQPSALEQAVEEEQAEGSPAAGA